MVFSRGTAGRRQPAASGPSVIRRRDRIEREMKPTVRLITPSTKGVMEGIPGVPPIDDVNVSRADLETNFEAFRFRSLADIDRYETLLTEGFDLISRSLAAIDQIFVDTKFEFGYVTDRDGKEQLIYMDEVGTPDSSRIWDGAAYREGRVVENSKEGFRQALLSHFPDPDILTNKARQGERPALAARPLPQEILMRTSRTYLDLAEKITGRPVQLSENPREEITAMLRDEFRLVD